MIKEMDREYLPHQVVINLKAIGLMIKEMGKEN
jgi:hypothetical protein